MLLLGLLSAAITFTLTLFEIALECGFANDAHFSRAFRQKFGVSPRQYCISS